MSKGGSIQEIGIFGRAFAVAGDSDSGRKLGGFENEVQANGNGTARVIMTAVTWMLSAINVEIDDDNGDHQFLQDIADRGAVGEITITYAGGYTWGGRGTLTGEISRASMATTAEINLSGPGKLTQQ